MAQLRQDYDAFAARDAEIVVIGPDNAKLFALFWEQQKLPFIGLPDPDHRVSDLYGQQVKWLKFGRMPALMVIDKAGQVRYRHYGSAMTDIVPNGELLALLDELNQPQRMAAPPTPLADPISRRN